MKHTDIIPSTDKFRNTWVRFNRGNGWTSPRRLVEPVIGVIDDTKLLIRDTPMQNTVVAHIVPETDVPGYVRAVCPPVPTEGGRGLSC